MANELIITFSDTYEKHDFDEDLYRDALASDPEYLALLEEYETGNPSARYRRALSYRLRQRRDFLASQVADPRGLQVLGTSSKTSDIIDSLFKGTTPNLSVDASHGAFDIAADVPSESDISSAPIHSIGTSVATLLSPYSHRARSLAASVAQSASDLVQQSRNDGNGSPSVASATEPQS
ncbi:hypothetical protein [Peromfec virus RodF5_9]|uniref:Uncharacterized protein n=1 Tax=Peromfec virus RodF5_9 TaxID=2929345 RepID=A0A976R5J7_9VIRU|nr:hypothetical protein [Peromfec virus RodF5_9]